MYRRCASPEMTSFGLLAEKNGQKTPKNALFNIMSYSAAGKFRTNKSFKILRSKVFSSQNLCFVLKVIYPASWEFPRGVWDDVPHVQHSSAVNRQS